MIITVIWEDQRAVQVRGFGPHELLLSCVADQFGYDRARLATCVSGHPAKGNTNVIKTLKNRAIRIAKLGPVFAVVDRDKIGEHWKNPGEKPLNCMSEIAARFRQEAEGQYDLVFLIDNVETLIKAALGETHPSVAAGKPTPAERDQILGGLAFGNDRSRRIQLLGKVPSFARLVERVGKQLARYGALP